MARQFNGTNQSLQSAAVVNLSAHSIITVAFWLYIDAYVEGDSMIIEQSANAYANTFNVCPDASGLGSRAYFGMGDVAGTHDGLCARPTAAAWHHWIVEYNKTAAVDGVLGINVWIDNVPKEMAIYTAAGTQTDPFISDTINLMSRDNASRFSAGRLFAVAIFAGVLTGTQRHALQTNAPDDIENTPLHYWPLAGTASPEPARAGGVAMTVNGATNVGDPLTLGNTAKLAIRKA